MFKVLFCFQALQNNLNVCLYKCIREKLAKKEACYSLQFRSCDWSQTEGLPLISVSTGATRLAILNEYFFSHIETKVAGIKIEAFLLM